MSVDAIARKENQFYLACFVPRSRSSQTHLGDYCYIETTKEEAQAIAKIRGFQSAVYRFNGHLIRRLNKATQ